MNFCPQTANIGAEVGHTQNVVGWPLYCAVCHLVCVVLTAASAWVLCGTRRSQWTSVAGVQWRHWHSGLQLHRLASLRGEHHIRHGRKAQHVACTGLEVQCWRLLTEWLSVCPSVQLSTYLSAILHVVCGAIWLIIFFIFLCIACSFLTVICVLGIFFSWCY